MAYDGPEPKIENVSVRKTSLNLSHVERFLCIAVGFNPARTKVKRIENVHPQTATFELVEETTSFLEALDKSYKVDPAQEPPFIDTLMMQLKEWDASPRDGNLLARRAAELIQHYQHRLANLPLTPLVDTGCKDMHGKSIMLGDRVRYKLEGPHTKPEYWNPEYEVIFDPPTFTLKHVGGGKPGDDYLFKLKHGGRNGYLEIIPHPEMSPVVKAV